MVTATDPMDTAMDAKPQARHYFGHLTVDCWYCVLEKGTGKVPFDPQQHSEDRKCTAIDLVLSPISRGDRAAYTVERNLIAESNEWAKTVLPSLKALNLGLRDIANKHVHVELVQLGTYTDKTGETKNKTAFKFLAVFPDERACQGAAAQFYASRSQTAEGAEAATETTAQQPAQQPVQPQNDAQRALAAKFLPGLWKAANGKVDVFEGMIKRNPMVARYFSLESPEVLQVMAPF